MNKVLGLIKDSILFYSILWLTFDGFVSSLIWSKVQLQKKIHYSSNLVYFFDLNLIMQ